MHACYFQIVQEYERAVIFRLGRLITGGEKGPGKPIAISLFCIIYSVLMLSMNFIKSAPHARCGQMRSTVTNVAWATVSLCVCWTQPWVVLKRLNRSRCRLGNALGWARIPSAEGTILGVVPAIILWKQQTPAAARGCRLDRRASASRQNLGSRMDSPAAGVTSAGAMRHFVKILWPLVRFPGDQYLTVASRANQPVVYDSSSIDFLAHRFSYRDRRAS